MDQSTCCIHDCGKPYFGSYLCSMHYSRLKRHGTTRLIKKPKPKCRMLKCNGKHFGKGWCQKHYQRIRANGSPFDKDQNWVIKDYDKCDYCDGPIPGHYELKKHCSNSCRLLANRGARPKLKHCISCGDEISLIEINKDTGRRKPSSVTRCYECSRHPNLSRFVPLLVERDGTICYLCDQDIDLSIAYPDPMSHQVDHVIPRRVGGPDHMDNYRLVHMKCNLDKRYQSGMIF